jgi:hypothetical protein
MKNIVFRNMKQFSLVDVQDDSEGSSSPSLGWKSDSVNILLPFYCEPWGSMVPEMSVKFHQTTRNHIPEDRVLNSHGYGNLKSDIYQYDLCLLGFLQSQ